MFCRFCGKENDNIARFCVGCGRSMEDDTINAAIVPPVDQSVDAVVQDAVVQTDIHSSQVFGTSAPSALETQSVMPQEAIWGPSVDNGEKKDFEYTDSFINQDPVIGQTIGQQQSEMPITESYITPTQEATNQVQNEDLFSVPSVRQMGGKSKKKKWLIPAIVGISVLIAGAVIVFAQWQPISKFLFPEKYLEKVVGDLAMAAPDNLSPLPTLEEKSGKAFSLTGDISLGEGAGSANFEYLYDKSGKQLQLTGGLNINGQVVEDISVYLTPKVLALLKEDLGDDFSYVKIALDTFVEDWNKSAYAENAKFEFPDIDISSFVENLFDVMSVPDIDKLFESDEEMKKAYAKFMDSIVFEDEGDEEINIADITINTSVMSYQIPGEAMEVFLADCMTISMNKITGMFDGFEMTNALGSASSYDGMFESSSFDDMMVTFFIDSTDTVRRIEIPFDMKNDVGESSEMYITMDMIGVENPMDSFELRIEANEETIVIERESTEDESKNTDYLAVYNGNMPDNVFMTYYMTLDKDKNNLEVEIETEVMKLILKGEAEVSDEKISLKNMVLTSGDRDWKDVQTLAEFSLEMSYVDVKDAFHNVNDKNSKDFFDLSIGEIGELK